MSDLTERLRWHADEAGAPREAFDLTNEAADRIAALEALTDRLYEALVYIDEHGEYGAEWNDDIDQAGPFGWQVSADARADYEADIEAHR